MLGIPGFQPNFYDDAAAFKTAHEAALKAAIGYPIQAYYLQWATDDDSWNADAPVILDIRGKHYECCAYKLNEFHLSIDQIDMNLPLSWAESSDEFPLIWKKNPIAEINHLLDKKIERIQIVEWQGMLVGLQFFLSTAPLPLSLLNALDENSLLIEELNEDEYTFIVI